MCLFFQSKSETYKGYIYKVLRLVHSDIGVSAKAMLILNSFIHDMFDKISDECSKLVLINKRKTITSREIQTAIRLVIPGELAKHAISEGMKAMGNYTNNIHGLSCVKEEIAAEN